MSCGAERGRALCELEKDGKEATKASYWQREGATIVKGGSGARESLGV